MSLPRVPEPTVTAPSWEANPIQWCLWYLRENGHLYAAFRREVDARLREYPNARISADAVLHHIRWTTPINAEGDLFAVNNNAAALFARLYIGERRHASNNFDRRKSLLDDLTPHEKWQLVNAARAIPTTQATQPALLEAPTSQRAWRP